MLTADIKQAVTINAAHNLSSYKKIKNKIYLRIVKKVYNYNSYFFSIHLLEREIY